MGRRWHQLSDAFQVLGGIHASFLPDEAGEHADTVVIGEAEETWPRLIADLKENRLQKRYEQGGRLPLNNLPIPRRSLFAEGAYIIKNTLAATRGCPYSCSFCSVSSFFGRTYRCRPVQDVVKELDTFNGGKYYFFVDDNIVGNPKFAKELFRAMIPYKIKWFGQASVTIAKDDELLELAAASGCIGLLHTVPPSLAGCSFAPVCRCRHRASRRLPSALPSSRNFPTVSRSILRCR